MEKLLRLSEVAIKLGTGTGRAAKLMREWRVPCLDLGRGRGGGLRWLESSIDDMLHQVISKKPMRSKPPTRPKSALADLSGEDIYALTHKGALQ